MYSVNAYFSYPECFEDYDDEVLQHTYWNKKISEKIIETEILI